MAALLVGKVAVFQGVKVDNYRQLQVQTTTVIQSCKWHHVMVKYNTFQHTMKASLCSSLFLMIQMIRQKDALQPRNKEYKAKENESQADIQRSSNNMIHFHRPGKHGTPKCWCYCSAHRERWRLTFAVMKRTFLFNLELQAKSWDNQPQPKICQIHWRNE